MTKRILMPFLLFLSVLLSEIDYDPDSPSISQRLRIIKEYTNSNFKEVKRIAFSWESESMDQEGSETLQYFAYLWLSKANYCMGHIDSSRIYRNKIYSISNSQEDVDDLIGEANRFIKEGTSSSDYFSHWESMKSIKEASISEDFTDRYVSISEMNEEFKTERKKIPSASQVESSKNVKLKYILSIPKAQMDASKGKLDAIVSGKEGDYKKIDLEFYKFERQNAIYNRYKRLKREADIGGSDDATLVFNTKYGNGDFVHSLRDLPIISGGAKSTFRFIIEDPADENAVFIYSFTTSDESKDEFVNIFWSSDWRLREVKDDNKILIYFPYSINNEMHYLYIDESNQGSVEGSPFHIGDLSQTEDIFAVDSLKDDDGDIELESFTLSPPDPNNLEMFKVEDREKQFNQHWKIRKDYQFSYGSPDGLVYVEYEIPSDDDGEIVIKLEKAYKGYAIEQRKNTLSRYILGGAIAIGLVVAFIL